MMPGMAHVVHVLYVVELDEDGVWCAHAQLRPGVGAHGQGKDEAAAVADLREALTGLIAEFGVPNELAIPVAAA
jgi:predicted RNase H-like HicB family nuclease